MSDKHLALFIMTFDWKKYRPKCVLIEMLGHNTEDIATTPIHKKMREKGYVLQSFYTITALYVKACG